MITASENSLIRSVAVPFHSGTGANDQSDMPLVTTAPRCGVPSDTSTPALIQ